MRTYSKIIIGSGSVLFAAIVIFFIQLDIKPKNDGQSAADQIFLFTKNDPREVMEFVKKYLPEAPIIVEAGAFDGNETIAMAAVFPKASIYSFEPDPENFNKLYLKTLSNKNIKTYSFALADRDGIAQFHRAFDAKQPENRQSGSLLAPKLHLQAFDIAFNQDIEVPAIKLATWAEKEAIDCIDFLWLDMQGAELNVMQASADLVARAKAIYTEVEFVEAYKGQFQYGQVKQWLEQQGFRLVAKDFYGDGNVRFSGNILMVKNS